MILKMSVMTFVFIFSAILFPISSECQAAADYIFINGKVYTVEGKNPWAEAVAVEKDKIAGVGKNSDIKKLAGPGTKVLDLKGRMLMPGFIDGHNHFLAGAFAKQGVKLNNSKDKAELLKRLADYVKANPGRTLYTGYGWTYPMMGDHKGTRHELDAISRDRPIVLFNDDSHSIWFNTKAMEMGGLTKDTPDPSSIAFYYREPDGTPEGIAAEGEAISSILIATGVMGGKDMLGNIAQEIFPILTKAGITSEHDMGIFAPELTKGYLGFELLMEMEKAGKLPCRFVGVYGVRDAGLVAKDHIAALKEWSQKYKSPMIQITGLKIWADGTPDSHTSVQLEPYADKPDTKGESGWTTPVLAEWIDRAYAEGFDLNIHAIGDGSVRRSLDAFELVQKKRGNEGRRSVIHHLDVIHPDDLPRFKQLGIQGNATLEWLIRDWDDALPLFGEKRRAKEYDIWKRLLDIGVNVSFGSDIPGTDPDELAPLYQMGIVATRSVPGAPEKTPPPIDRNPSLTQMVYGYTMAGAIQMCMEDKIGSIEKGKLADLIILDKNIFEIPPNELFSTRILMTMLNGRIIYKEGDLTK